MLSHGQAGFATFVLWLAWIAAAAFVFHATQGWVYLVGLAIAFVVGMGLTAGRRP